MIGSTAQQQPPTVTSVLNMLYGVVEQEVVSAAEAMPEDSIRSRRLMASLKAFALSLNR